MSIFRCILGSIALASVGAIAADVSRENKEKQAIEDEKRREHNRYMINHPNHSVYYLSQQLEEKESEVESLTASLNAANETVELKTNQIKALGRRNDSLRDENTALKCKVSEIQKSLEEAGGEQATAVVAKTYLDLVKNGASYNELVEFRKTFGVKQ